MLKGELTTSAMIAVCFDCSRSSDANRAFGIFALFRCRILIVKLRGVLCLKES